MAAPSVRGYMVLCVTPRSQVCDEQGVGQWPMWKRFDSVKAIVDQYVDEPYRSFLALPYYDIDKLKAEELFYWYTPSCATTYSRLSRTADDHGYYKKVFDKTLAHYQSVVSNLKNKGLNEEAEFLRLSLINIGQSEDNVYCGDGRVVATVWGMRPRPMQQVGESKLFTDLLPEQEIHTVQFLLGSLGSTGSPVTIKKTHGTKIHRHQVPQVTPQAGYQFIGWDIEPIGAEVTGDLRFTAEYKEIPKDVHQESDKADDKGPDDKKTGDGQYEGESGTQNNIHHVRFLTPDNLIIKELDVEHGERIMPGDVPQLPAVDNVICPAWNGDPLNDAIVADRDYRAIAPKKPEKEMHAVRFLDPEKRVLLQTRAEHGSVLPPSHIPPLPVVDGKVCPSWNVNPLTEAINHDMDFIANKPQETAGKNDKDGKSKKMHMVRFLNQDGGEMIRTAVEHGSRVSPDRIPALPSLADSEARIEWSPDPGRRVIRHDTDFKVRQRRAWRWTRFYVHWGGHSLWRWLLYIVLFLLLVLLILYIMYLNDPSSL